MLEINTVLGLLAPREEDPARVRAEAEASARARAEVEASAAEATAAKAAATEAATAKRQAQQVANRRRARQHNQRIAELQNQARHEQHQYMAALNADYPSVAERNLALTRARASMMAAHIARDLATTVPVTARSPASTPGQDSSSVDTFA